MPFGIACVALLASDRLARSQGQRLGCQAKPTISPLSSSAQSTCWTVIRGAAAGDAAERAAFADRYEDTVRAYIAARWQRSPLLQEVDDAIQEVFVETFRAGGVLERVDPDSPGGFRAFFYGVVRNVALRFESRHGKRRDRQPATDFFAESADSREHRLSRIFDRGWARSIMREAAARQRTEAAETRGDALKRVQLLRLRFYEGLPIRDIARLWDEDATYLHREYAQARREFRRSLSEVVAFHHPGSTESIERECIQLLAMLK